MREPAERPVPAGRLAAYRRRSRYSRFGAPTHRSLLGLPAEPLAQFTGLASCSVSDLRGLPGHVRNRKAGSTIYAPAVALLDEHILACRLSAKSISLYDQHKLLTAIWRLDRRHRRTDCKTPFADIVVQGLSVSSSASIEVCGSTRNRSTPPNFTPSTSARWVMSSIVSRSIGGSLSSPMPTRPGHMASCNLGQLWLRIRSLPSDMNLAAALEIAGWTTHPARRARRSFLAIAPASFRPTGARTRAQEQVLQRMGSGAGGVPCHGDRVVRHRFRACCGVPTPNRTWASVLAFSSGPDKQELRSIEAMCIVYTWLAPM